MEPSGSVVRDCNTCAHHVQAPKSIDDAPARCWDCTRCKSLPLWEPIAVKNGTVVPVTKAELEAYCSTLTDDSASSQQVGGNHYTKCAIQPMEYSMANGLDACQHTIIKYVTRFRDKNGIEDLRKARHTIDLLIQFEEKKE